MTAASLSQTRLYPLDDSGSEVLIAPLFNPSLAATVDFNVTATGDVSCTGDQEWCWYRIRWHEGRENQTAVIARLRCDVAINRYDTLVCAATLQETIEVAISVVVDGAMRRLGTHRGTGRREEIRLPIDGQRLSAVILSFSSSRTEEAITLSWLGLADRQTCDALSQNAPSYPPDWHTLIREDVDWSTPTFQRGLFMSEADLKALRAKKSRPGWDSHFAELRERANQAMQRNPEEDIGTYPPWSDSRYLRQSQQGKEPYFWEAQMLAIVGLVDNDSGMMKHAVRYLLSMVHCTFWCESDQCRLVGSNWTHRCFLEEMMTSTVAILYDWFGFALTDIARAYVLRSIWDKGLANIEREIMQYAYLQRSNQGIWFCRARVLGGLLLEDAWPATGDYVDRAAAYIQEGLDKFLHEESGCHEGMGYFSLTLHASLHALYAYARARDREFKDVLPKKVLHMESFVAAMSSLRPGGTVMDGDQSTDYFIGDTLPILASLFPDSVYTRILKPNLLKPRPPTYFHQYVCDGVFGFVLGPTDVQDAETVVPTFQRLPAVGHLSSCRVWKDRRVRLFMTGCPANPGHSHKDKGAFTLEVGEVPILIDRGTVRYDDPRADLLSASSMHNLVTPLGKHRNFPDQVLPAEPILVEGTGDQEQLTAEVDLLPAWGKHFKECRRRLNAPSPTIWEIQDTLERRKPGRVAFHLHALEPFQIEEQHVQLTVEGVRLSIKAAWADQIEQNEDGIDYLFRPVYHLVISSEVGRVFQLTTQFQLQ